jgi:hypothetical protein
MAAEQFIQSTYGALVSWTYLLLSILIFVKLIQLASSLGLGKGLGSLLNFANKGGGDGEKIAREPNTTDETRSDPEKQKKKAEAEKFEQGMENPAFLKVWVMNLDRQNVEGAEVDVIPKGYKGNLAYKGHRTNSDGRAPGDGSDFLLPARFPIQIYVTYKLGKYEKYKSKKHLINLGPIELIQRRTLKHDDTIQLMQGEKKIHTIQLPFFSEKNLGFEPHVESLDRIGNGKIRARGRVISNTGGGRP